VMIVMRETSGELFNNLLIRTLKKLLFLTPTTNAKLKQSNKTVSHISC